MLESSAGIGVFPIVGWIINWILIMTVNYRDGVLLSDAGYGRRDQYQEYPARQYSKRVAWGGN